MRDPEITRQKILDVAALEIHARGFKATSLSDILAAAGISKGALYHHFKNKQELGYSVMEEVFVPMLMAPWAPAFDHEDPIGAMSAVIRQFPLNLNEDDLAKGCPMTNICSEMSTLDEGFRQRSEGHYEKLVEKMANAISRADCHDKVDPMRSAMFILASMNGIISVMKGIRCHDTFTMLNDELANYIESLRSDEARVNAKPVELPPMKLECERFGHEPHSS